MRCRRCWESASSRHEPARNSSARNSCAAQFLPRNSLTRPPPPPQLIQLSRKLEESESRENVSKLGNIGDRLSGSFKARTDNSLLDRLGINRF